MKLDVYVCTNDHEFAIRNDEEPILCPLCATDEFDFSHEVDLLEAK